MSNANIGPVNDFVHVADGRRGSRRSRKPGRPLVATAVAIGGAGIILGAPATGLLAAPGLAQGAAPVVPAPLQTNPFESDWGHTAKAQVKAYFEAYCDA